MFLHQRQQPRCLLKLLLITLLVGIVGSSVWKPSSMKMLSFNHHGAIISLYNCDASCSNHHRWRRLRRRRHYCRDGFLPLITSHITRDQNGVGWKNDNDYLFFSTNSIVITIHNWATVERGMGTTHKVVSFKCPFSQFPEVALRLEPSTIPRPRRWLTIVMALIEIFPRSDAASEESLLTTNKKTRFVSLGFASR